MHADQHSISAETPVCPEGFLDLRYRGRDPIVVRGTITGSLYRFSGSLPVRPVDLRDARFLLASRLFTLLR